MAGIELVAFDCDGVLVDSEMLAMRGYQATVAGLGIEVTEALWGQCIGHKQAEIFAELERASGRAIAAEVRQRLWPLTRQLFEAELRPTPGLPEFLRNLTTKRCVASSSDPERIRLSLRFTDLDRFFGDAVFSSQAVAHGKPAPDLFLHAAKCMGVAPRDMLVVEDSVPGVIGARAAGARVIGFIGGAHIGAGHGDRLLSAGAEFVAETWPAVAQLILHR